jgi:DNA-binding response OmpR family regulator
MGKCVLLVEDEPELVQLVRLLLKKVDCEVISAPNAVEAMEKLKNEEIDLVLLDLILPDANGWTVLEEVKKNNELKDLPIIVFTAKSADKRDLRYIEKYNLPVLKKPFNSHELMKQITRYAPSSRNSD